MYKSGTFGTITIIRINCEVEALEKHYISRSLRNSVLFVLAWVALVTRLREWCASVEGVAVIVAWGHASMSVVGDMLV